jgi:hypothetical protein
MQPVHESSDWRMAEARLGPDRLRGSYAWASMQKTGARLAFGSDYPVESPNPFVGWAVAFTREDAKGEPVGGWHPDEKVSREAAWKAFTSDAAYAGFAEDRFGTLAPGMRADFLIVDRDPTLATRRTCARPRSSRPGSAGKRCGNVSDYIRKRGFFSDGPSSNIYLSLTFRPENLCVVARRPAVDPERAGLRVCVVERPCSSI